ncbi:MAG TPA: hypothetical protein VK137_01630, partial [Planctomycetaceae bacterium]|nr:hypothetical protein [Planctomycetaceae bacterium]
WGEGDKSIRVATLPMADVRKGDLVVVGHRGTRVLPQGRDRDKLGVFGFMQSTVSSEKPKNVTIREIAAEMRRAKQGDGKILVVAGRPSFTPAAENISAD